MLKGLPMRLRCLSYGIFYTRSGKFHVPGRLWVRGRMRRFLFNRPDTGAFQYEFREICLNDCYRLKTLKECLPDIKTIVDVGANQGLFLLAARKNFPNANIYGYEPNPHLMPQLLQNGKAVKAAVLF